MKNQLWLKHMANIKRKDINLLKQMKQSDTKEFSFSLAGAFVICFLLVAVVLSAIYIVMLVERNNIKNDYDDLFQKYSNEELILNSQRSELLLKDISNRNEAFNSIKSIVDKMELVSADVKRLSKDLITDIQSAATGSIAISSISISSGIVSLSCEGISALDASRYVQALKETEMFVSCTYSGYAGNDGKYYFNISLVLS